MRELEANVRVVQAIAGDEVEGEFALVFLIKYAASQSAYTDWLDAILPRLDKVRARIVWAGNGGDPIVGSPDRDWDAVAIVQFPSRKAFLDLVQADGFGTVEDLRRAGMSRNEVYACTPVIDALPHD